MNKFIKTILISTLLIPSFVFSATAVGWSTNSPTTGWFSPNKINGVNQVINALAGLFTNASSTFSGNLYFPALTQGFLYTGSAGKVGTVSTSTIFGFTPANQATTITVNGTANQITSSAGAQDLSANRTWTLSFPNQVIFPQYASTTNGFSTPYASSTIGNIGTLTVGTLSGILKGTSGLVSTASNGTDYTLITANTCGAGQHFSQVTASGIFTCTADTGGSGLTWPWTLTTNFGQTVNSTTTALWLRGSPISLMASSTSWFDTINVSSQTATSSIANFGGERDASMYSGSDMCAKVNNAYNTSTDTSVNIVIPAGTYRCSTQTLLNTSNKHVWLHGKGDAVTTIIYTGQSTSTVIDTGQDGYQSKLSDLTIMGTSTTDIAPGIEFGGTSGFAYSLVENVNVSNFGKNISIGNNTYITEFNNVVSNFARRNALAFEYNTNSGENLTFNHFLGADNNQATGSAYANCVVLNPDPNIGAASIFFNNSSFDKCSIVVGAEVNVFGVNNHFEILGNTSTAYTPIVLSGDANSTLNLKNTRFTNGNDVSHSPTSWISKTDGNIDIDGATINDYGGYTIPYFVSNTGSGARDYSGLIRLGGTGFTTLELNSDTASTMSLFGNGNLTLGTTTVNDNNTLLSVFGPTWDGSDYYQAFIGDKNYRGLSMGYDSTNNWATIHPVNPGITSLDLFLGSPYALTSGLFLKASNGYQGLGTTSPTARLSVNPVAGDSMAFIVGSSTKNLFSLDTNGVIKIATTTAGCLNVNTVGLIYSATCSTSSSSFGFPFTVQPGYNSTSTVIGFTNGLFSMSTTTLNGTRLTDLSQGIAYIGSNGIVKSTATSSFSLSQFTNDLANLSATDSTLTFSGNYNGSVARTVGLNLGNANTWTVNQTFNYSSSTAYSSFVRASTTNLIINGQSFNNLLGTGLSNSSGALTVSSVPNSALQNSTISGVSLGSNLNSLSHDSTLSGTSYNGSASVSDWGLNLTNANLWTGLQRFTNSSTTLGSFSYASSTQWFGGGLTSCSNGTTDKLLWNSTTGQFSCGTDQGAGSGITSYDAWTHPSAGISATTSQIVISGATTSVQNLNISGNILDTNGNKIIGITPTAGAVNYFTVANTASGDVTLGVGGGGNSGLLFSSSGYGGVGFKCGNDFANCFKVTNTSLATAIDVDTSSMTFGIATDSPSAVLSVHQTSSSIPAMILSLFDDTVSLFIDALGKVGIGKTKPQHPLDVEGRISSQPSWSCEIPFLTQTAVTADQLGSATVAPFSCGGHMYLDVNQGGQILPLSAANDLIASGTPQMQILDASASSPTGASLIFMKAPFSGSATSTNGLGIAMEATFQTPKVGTATTSVNYVPMGFSDVAITSLTTPASYYKPTNGVLMIASSSANWKLVSWKAGVATMADTGLATSTTAQTALLVVDATGANLYLNGSNVSSATISASALPVVNLRAIQGVGLSNGTAANQGQMRVGNTSVWIAPKK